MFEMMLKVHGKELGIYALILYENWQDIFDLLYLNVYYTKRVLPDVIICKLTLWREAVYNL